MVLQKMFICVSVHWCMYRYIFVDVLIFCPLQISRPVDIFLSHDWPRGIYNFGNVNMLLKKKQYFREEVEQDRLGSPAAKELLFHIKPDYWFAAHLHVKFPAIVQHQVITERTAFYCKMKYSTIPTVLEIFLTDKFKNMVTFLPININELNHLKVVLFF